MEQFPFDKQTCALLFLFARDDFLRIVRLKAFTNLYLRTHEEAEEWALLEMRHTEHYHKLYYYEYDGSIWRKMNANTNTNRTYRIPAFKAILVLKRHSQYYVFILVIPVFVMTVCNLFSVFLPSNSDSKLEFLATVLNGFIFIQTILANLLPRIEGLPLIANYVVLSLGLCLFNTVGCVFVVSAGSFGELHSSKPPRILSLIFIVSFCTLSRVFWWIVSKLCPCWKYAQKEKIRSRAISTRLTHTRTHSNHQNNINLQLNAPIRHIGEIIPHLHNSQMVDNCNLHLTADTSTPAPVLLHNRTSQMELNVYPNTETPTTLLNNLSSSRGPHTILRPAADPFSRPRLERLPPRNQRWRATDRTQCYSGVLFEVAKRPENENAHWLASCKKLSPLKEHVSALSGESFGVQQSTPAANGAIPNDLTLQSTPNSQSHLSTNFTCPPNTFGARQRRQLEDEVGAETEQNRADAAEGTANGAPDADEAQDPHAADETWPVLARNLNILVSLCYVAGNLYAARYLVPLMSAWMFEPHEQWWVD